MGPRRGRDTPEERTAATRARYDRIAPVYDLMEAPVEPRFSKWRASLWSRVPPGRVLEVGVGTGKNFPFYPREAHVVGIDLSPRMLARARRRAHSCAVDVELREMDVERLDFPDANFDAAVATFVFCSVADPERGLAELGRVVRPDGAVLLLEHVRIDHPKVVGAIMDLLDPVIVRLVGPHLNRRTLRSVEVSGLELAGVEHLGPAGVVKLIAARAAKRRPVPSPGAERPAGDR